MILGDSEKKVIRLNTPRLTIKMRFWGPTWEAVVTAAKQLWRKLGTIGEIK